MSDTQQLQAAMAGTERTEFAGVTIDTGRVGDARVRRLVYRPGFRWSADIQPLVGGEACEHVHVGFLAQGRIEGRYADGCEFAFAAPQVVAIDPGHDALVGPDEPAVLIEIDFERDTVERLGVAPRHAH